VTNAALRAVRAFTTTRTLCEQSYGAQRTHERELRAML
jgi:hypothetical protein